MNEISAPAVDGSLRQLIQKAANNIAIGSNDSYGADITHFLRILEKEWIADVHELRRLDSATLDSLLPPLLSREVQRLLLLTGGVGINDCRRKDFHRDRRRRTSSWGPFATKGARLSSPPIMTRIDSSSSSTTSGDEESIFLWTPTAAVRSTSWQRQLRGENEKQGREVNCAASASSNSNKNVSSSGSGISESQSERDLLDKFYDPFFNILERFVCSSCIHDAGEGAAAGSSKSDDNTDDSLLVADEDEKANSQADDAVISTREELEDAIEVCRVRIMERRGCDSDADGDLDQLRHLATLRLVLPTRADLVAMMDALQSARESAMRNGLDMNKADRIRGEIAELKTQLEREERYLLNKKFACAVR